MPQNSSLPDENSPSIPYLPTSTSTTGNAIFNKQNKRLVTTTMLAILIAVGVSYIAKFLVYLIQLFTSIAFHGSIDIASSSPANNTLGIFVIGVPVVGGIIVGLMAYFGSEAIRGHGIPEAMEQILTNQSKIKPAITYLKPLSSAISIGTGGPFGAEGPIIATGGALGSTLGQVLKISHHERKILLAAGAAAGMSAIFGSPIAAIFLAIELLLFEFSPRSIIPVAMACITGAAGHNYLFGHGPVFAMLNPIESPSNAALAVYSIMGIILGGLSVGVTKFVYFIEDSFEKLPIHWMWWPAIGGIVVGVVGYFSPRTLGVGYENITDILSGKLPLQIILSLCLLKFFSWAIALSSGTSGGTLAPLMTIGGATGALIGYVIFHIVPSSGVTLPLAALVGMSAMFAGASRALVTSIIFALETTGQANALVALLTSCTASYFVSYIFMENTLMTEKIARRGVVTPSSYKPDILEKTTIDQVITENGVALNEDDTIGEVREWHYTDADDKNNYFIIVNKENELKGIISSSDLFNNHRDPQRLVGSLIEHKNISITSNHTLRTAVEMMLRENVDVLPVVSNENKIIGILSYKDIMSAYREEIEEHEKKRPHISLKRNSLKILLHGKRLIEIINKREGR